jgi:hypothetical protein
MKKILVLIAGVFLAGGPSQAATGNGTAEFLKKLNGYYYCLSREGLKDFHCDLSCSLSPDSEKKLRAKKIYDKDLWASLGQLRFSVDGASGQPASIQSQEPPSTGSKELDDRVAKLNGEILEILKAFFSSWQAFGVESLNDPADIDRGNLKYQKDADGFKIIQNDPNGGVITGSFDKKGKLLQLTAGGADSATTVQTDFTYTAKGYLLKGLAITAPGVDQNCRVTYGLVGSFWMPKGLGVGVRLPEAQTADIGLIFNFSNYQVNR